MMKIPSVMIAAMASGSGKTSVACSLMAALKKRGKRVAACKCGPDYIDPMFHREVLGIDSENLDLFFCSEDLLRKNYIRHAQGSEITVVEGVMGYYDGMALSCDWASSYDVARTLGIPVILVLPCRGMGLTVAALLKGAVEFRKDSHIRGIILNRISPMLYPRMKNLIEAQMAEMGHQIRVVGYVPEHEVFQVDSRHLGLVLPEEIPELKSRMEQAARVLEESVDLDEILEIAKEAAEFEAETSVLDRVDDAGKPEKSDLDKTFYAETGRENVRIAGDLESAVQRTVWSAGEGPVIGIARDEAFGFYYKDNIELLKKFGCRILYFSPLRDAKIPEEADGILLGGGYPEVYAARLAANRNMREDLCRRVRGGLPCIAECGGFLYLQKELEGTDGTMYPMAGALIGTAVRKQRLVRFGYIDLSAQEDGVYLKKGEKIRGHEFHYWDSSENGSSCLAVKPDKARSWQAVQVEGKIFAGFPHLYWESCPEFAERFVEVCLEYKRKREL
ncbi:cobyrinate a,c-diamide synthase [Roseburia hominis]